MKQLLSALVLLAIFVACGSSDPETNSESGNCGTQVVSDYNSMVTECSYMTSRNDLQSCQSKLDTFKGKYPNINCEASGYDGQTKTITAGHIDNLISTAKNL